MMRKFLVMMFLLIGMFGLVVPAVCAASSGPALRQDKAFVEKKDAKMQQFFQELNLTEEQKKLLNDNKNKHREQMKIIFQQKKDKMALIRQEVQKNELDMEKIIQINNELKELESKMLDLMLQGILDVRKILTAEQFKKFMEQAEKHRRHFDNTPGASIPSNR
ncbi:MAG: periplasmic heavy metal sensor [Candidatus Omnitrophica bacterium]|nr:periplasmic heavy metal sensor [Candidatus Omnitrophota bacterium]